MVINTANSSSIIGAIIIGWFILTSSLSGQNTEKNTFRVHAKAILVDSSESRYIKSILLDIVERLDTNSGSVCRKRFVVLDPYGFVVEEEKEYIITVRQFPQSKIYADSLYPSGMMLRGVTDDCFALHLRESDNYHYVLWRVQPLTEVKQAPLNTKRKQKNEKNAK